MRARAATAIRRNARLAAALGLAALLAGCDEVTSAISGALPETGVRAMKLMEGTVVAQGPAGYCIDARTSRPETGFAVMGGCGILSRMGIMPQSEGLVTVQFGAPGSAAVAGSEEDLVALLRSARGAQILSSSGLPESILVDAIESEDGLVLVRFQDTAPPIAAGLERTEWRAFLDIAGRLATVTARGFERAPMDSAAGRLLIGEAVAALRAANAPQAAANG